MKTYARHMIVKHVLWNECSSVCKVREFRYDTRIWQSISSLVTTLHSAVVVFCAIESNSCTFQVASSSGNLLRSDSKYMLVHALPFYDHIGVGWHVRVYQYIFYFLVTILTKIWPETDSCPVKRVQHWFFMRFCSRISLSFSLP